MTTLHERLIGENLTINDGEKIAIHAFVGALHEGVLGKLTPNDIAGLFELTSAQVTQGTVLMDLLSAAPDPIRFIRVLKDWLYMGEVAIHSRYSLVTSLVSRLQDEITDQGGTLP